MVAVYVDPVIKALDRPRFLGIYIMGINFILVNDADLLEEIFVKKNALFTKHESKREGGKPLIYNNIVSMDTHHPAYAPKRRALSSAFFKGKVQNMVSSIKRIALEYFKEFQDQGEKVEYDLVKMTMQLQARIIIDILVGKGYSTKKIKYEKVDGTTD